MRIRSHDTEAASARATCGSGAATSTRQLFRTQSWTLSTEFERETINERVVGGMAEKAAQRRRVGGPVPYGYVLCADGTTAIAETQASEVRRIFAKRRAGKTIACIAQGS